MQSQGSSSDHSASTHDDDGDAPLNAPGSTDSKDSGPKRSGTKDADSLPDGSGTDGAASTNDQGQESGDQSFDAG